MIDQLITQIEKKNSPICAGLDTKLEYIPPSMLSGNPSEAPFSYAAQNILRYNCALIDAFADIVPCVKLQSAYYEMYGPEGIDCFAKTLQYAKDKGLLTIADVKRNDIGSTAQAYASAYIGEVQIGDELKRVFDSDFMTVNAYLGTDGIQPFVDCCSAFDKGVFVLVKTSNVSSGELQDLELRNGTKIYERMMDRVDLWGSGLVGKNGYSEVGAVVGATFPQQAIELRRRHPFVFFLLPGAGKQGADISKLAGCFDKKGRGGIINNSREMLCAWQKKENGDKNAPEEARNVLLKMQKTINQALHSAGAAYDRDGADYVE